MGDWRFGLKLVLLSINHLFIMRSILYIVAVILVIFWAIGFIGYHAGGIIHVLLVIALISIILGVIRRA